MLASCATCTGTQMKRAEAQRPSVEPAAGKRGCTPVWLTQPHMCFPRGAAGGA